MSSKTEHIAVPQKKIEEWVQNKLNIIVYYLQVRMDIKDDVEARYIVSKKPKIISEDKIQKSCKCKIKIMSKLELIDDVISKIDQFLANELKPIVS